VLALVHEDVGETAVGLRTLCVAAENGFVIRPRLVKFAALAEAVGEIHPRFQVIRDKRHDFAVNLQRRFMIAHRAQQRAQVVERDKLRGILREDGEIDVLGLVKAFELDQKARPLDFQVDPAGVALECLFNPFQREFTQDLRG